MRRGADGPWDGFGQLYSTRVGNDIGIDKLGSKRQLDGVHLNEPIKSNSPNTSCMEGAPFVIKLVMKIPIRIGKASLPSISRHRVAHCS